MLAHGLYGIAERVKQGFTTQMVAAKLASEGPWLEPGGPPFALAAWTGLENSILTLYGAEGSERLFDN